MAKCATVAGLVALLVFSGVRVSVSAPDEKSSCEVCHSKIAATYKGSVHAAARIVCARCHGGDPGDMAITSMSHGAKFTGAPSRAEIPQFCASCHSDRHLMKQYGLPTHQLEDYKTSGHGVAWAAGDTKAAVCTDCHGQHGIRAVDDSQSAVNRANVADTCARCHADAKMMASYGLPVDVHDEYKKSSHAKMLEGEGRAAAPSCPQCHGAHTALPPTVGEISNVCGQCHGMITEVVLDSPHAKPAKPGGIKLCESCHGHHAIVTPQPAMLRSVCRDCHTQGSLGATVGQRISQLISEAAHHYDEAVSSVDSIETHGATEDLHSRLEEGHTALEQLATSQHSLSPEKVEQETVVIRSVADEVLGTVEDVQRSLAARRLALVPVWVYVLGSVATLYWKRRGIEERHAGGSHSGGGD